MKDKCEALVIRGDKGRIGRSMDNRLGLTSRGFFTFTESVSDAQIFRWSLPLTRGE